MSRRRDNDIHCRSLDEIRNIMNSMKNLSYMETRKISGFLDAQHAVVKHIGTVAADFLSFYTDLLSEKTDTFIDVHILIGTERGFCGDFNHALLRHFESLQIIPDKEKRKLISVGHKLSTLQENEEYPATFIDGASVAEEVGNVLNQVVNQLVSIQKQYGAMTLSVLYHDEDLQLINRQLLPPFRDLDLNQSQHRYAPKLNIEPGEFFLELSHQYLFAVLYEILYTSLMAESRKRVAHLEGAVQHMEEQSEELHRQSNILRQEEIIEEIEVILLNATSFDEQLSNDQKIEK
jgi:F-type H+-transporting ATPase subunit gamma